MFAQSVGPSDLYPRTPGVVMALWFHTTGIVVDRVPATAEHMFLARFVRLSLNDMQVSLLRSGAMNGVMADEVGRSINATGSRNTGTTVCLIRLGAVIPSGKATKIVKTKSAKRLSMARAASDQESPRTPACGTRGRMPDTAGDSASKPAGHP